jgi:hypothetical protein
VSSRRFLVVEFTFLCSGTELFNKIPKVKSELILINLSMFYFLFSCAPVTLFVNGNAKRNVSFYIGTIIVQYFLSVTKNLTQSLKQAQLYAW